LSSCRIYTADCRTWRHYHTIFPFRELAPSTSPPPIQTTTAAGATLTHDAKGNLTSDGVWTYAFDADNKLKQGRNKGRTTV